MTGSEGTEPPRDAGNKPDGKPSKRVEETIRQATPWASGIGGLISTVSGLAALFQNSNHVALSLVLTVVGIALLVLGIYLWQHGSDRVHVPLWLVTGAAAVTILAVGAAAVALAILIRQNQPDDHPLGGVTAQITSPRNGQQADIAAGLPVVGKLSGITPAFCRSHHVWIVGSAPTGAHGQELYSARRELTCSDGQWSFRDEITKRPWHRYAVRVTGTPEAQQYMLENMHAWKIGDYSQDGRWVDLPEGVDLVSAIIQIPT